METAFIYLMGLVSGGVIASAYFIRKAMQQQKVAMKAVLSSLDEIKPAGKAFSLPKQPKSNSFHSTKIANRPAYLKLVKSE